ncbi:hypothetical protein L3X38_034266 [Prunus dulcis]|uniref:Uncharacterized protein n=1 Tax=Prunus dulcis TaxID=3755 RepID=A0AAD4YWP7_PRUDU|nr:hypothetical protein L3X38_034266 [Prunus dulcis]
MEGRSSPLAWRPCIGQQADLQIDTKVGFWQSFTFSSRFVRPFEWAELQLLLLGRDRSGYSRWSDELGIALREFFCLNRALPEVSGVSTFVKTRTLLVLAFCRTKFITRDLVLGNLFSKSEPWNSDLRLVSLGIQRFRDVSSHIKSLVGIADFPKVR